MSANADLMVQIFRGQGHKKGQNYMKIKVTICMSMDRQDTLTRNVINTVNSDIN